MKLSEKMTARLVALLGENAHEYVAKKNRPTYAALERRGLIEWGERRIGSSYRIRLTDAGRALAEELRGDAQEPEEIPEDMDDYESVMFPEEMARVRAAYPVGTHVTGVSRRGERASGTITGYAQSGSPRDGYSTAVEIEHADGTGEYTLINAEDVAEADKPDEAALSEVFSGPTWDEIVRSEEESDIPAPAPLPKRTPGTHTEVQDAINRHHTTKKEKPMFETYAPRPRPSVEAVEVTDDNLAEIAELFGAEYEEGASQVAVDLPIGDGQVIWMGLGVGVVLVRRAADNYSVIPAHEFHDRWIADHS